MDTIKNFFYLLLRGTSIFAGMAFVMLGAFFITMFVVDPEMASDFAGSCVSCKDPFIVIAENNGSDRLASDEGEKSGLTMKDLKIILSPAGTEPKVDVESGPTKQQKVAIDRVNYYRGLVGLGPVTLNKDINEAALAHAQYDAKHNLAGHIENEGDEGFTGTWPWDRMRHFGYDNFTYATEVCSTRWASSNDVLDIDPKWAVDSWIDTVYHRLPLINPNVYEAGFGSSKAKNRVAYVMDFANPGFSNKMETVYYPVNGQENVPTEFYGDETPDPLPGKTYPVGYPVTITFNGYSNIVLKRAEFTDDAGANVEFYKILPFSDKFIGESLAIIPTRPLKQGMIYHVSVSVEIDDKPVYIEWQFKTRD